MRVDFMMIGAQKCGTTSLAGQMANHPQICFSRKKEPGYFNHAGDWRTRLQNYHKLFSPMAGQLCGEASTMYTFLPEYGGTARRLYEYNPALKLIYIMRQPVERIISHYAHNLVRGLVEDAPNDVILSDPAYINRSRYAVQIRPYLQLFGQENVLLLFFEEYITDQEAILRKISEFLSIEPLFFTVLDKNHNHKTTGRPYLKYETARRLARTDFFQSIRTKIPAPIRFQVKRQLSNQIEMKPEFEEELKNLLWQLLEDDVLALEKIIGRDLHLWRSGYAQ